MDNTTHNTLVGSESFDDLYAQVQVLLLAARQRAAVAVHTIQAETYFEIGRRIVEHEQAGQDRAAYGKQVLKRLAERLTQDFGRGFSHRNLEYMRRFYLEYRERAAISQMASAKFNLSWSQYVFLLSISSPDERRFYEIEAAQGGWKLPELRRQFDSGLYQRLSASRDPEAVRALATQGQVIERPEDMIKDPYVLEFLGLQERASYSESDLETAILDHLEAFLLELGKGFLFEARQKRFTFEEEHFFVDLVFYNRLLRCYVLIDLKIGKLAHQDLGQMQMYVNYFDRYVRQEGENSTVGIVLCRRKNDALVELTLPEEANIYASRYELYLPSKAELQKEVMESEAKLPGDADEDEVGSS
jgi:predicted nuclease of restriction endonuclease-like (RecB) superfamily